MRIDSNSETALDIDETKHSLPARRRGGASMGLPLVVHGRGLGAGAGGGPVLGRPRAVRGGHAAASA